MKLFCDPDFARLLDLHRLNDFDALWNLGEPTVQDPNVRRGGWNGVSHLRLSDENGTTHSFFLKRQQNDLIPYGLLMQKKPTFHLEFVTILFCWERNIPCLDATYYGVRKQPAKGRFSRDSQAILIIRMPDSHTPFSDTLSTWKNLSEDVRYRYLDRFAAFFAAIHKNGLSANSVSPKDLFVNLEADPAIKMMHIEKMGLQILRTRVCVAELETFVRKAGAFSAAELEFLLERYCRNNPSGLPLEKAKKALSSGFKAKIARKEKPVLNT